MRGLASPSPALTVAAGNANATKSMNTSANEKMLVFMFGPVRGCLRSSGRSVFGPPAVSCHASPTHFGIRTLVAAVGRMGLLDLPKDASEIVAFRRLQRRELLVGGQVLQPQLLADRQHVPVILE